MRAKLVRESVNFQRGGDDPLRNLGLGIPFHPWTLRLKPDNEFNGDSDRIKFFEEKMEDPESRSLMTKILKYLVIDEKIYKVTKYGNMFSRSYMCWWYASLGFFDMDPELFKHFWERDFRAYNFSGNLNNGVKKENLEHIYYKFALETCSPNQLWTKFQSDQDNKGLVLAAKAGAKNIKTGGLQNFIIAAEKKDLELLKILLDRGSDPSNAGGKHGNNYAIVRACTTGWVEGVKLLLADSRVDPSDRKNAALAQTTLSYKTAQNDPGNLKFSRKYDQYQDDIIEICKLLLQDRRVRAKFHECPQAVKRLKEMNLL